MKKQILAGLGLLLAAQNAAFAQQEKCGTALILRELKQQRPEKIAAYEQLRKDLQLRDAASQQASAAGLQFKTTAPVGTIPVVFHIVLNASQIAALGGVAGIEQRINTQLNTLNADYNRGNADSTTIPAAFKPLYGNAEIRFGLAHRTPTGAGTPGYELKTTTLSGFDANSNFGSDPKAVNTGGLASWNPKRYLNIWIVNINEAGVLGYTTPPSLMAFGFDEWELGVVIDYGAFGARSNAGQFFSPSTNDRGRTGTHEVGHYLELEHTFGNYDNLCPGQTAPNGDVETDDGIADTPPQSSATYGNCPNFPQTDACSPTGNGIMWMNYMDYVDDKCMVMFTNGQSVRMKNQLVAGQYSEELVTHPELLQWPVSVKEVENAPSFALVPNPSNGSFSISFGQTPKGLRSISVANAMGQQVRRIEALGNSNIYNVDLSGMSKGVYFVQCLFEGTSRTEKIVLQ